MAAGSTLMVDGWMPSPFITLLLVHQTILFNVPNPFLRVGAVPQFHWPPFVHSNSLRDTGTRKLTMHGHNSQAAQEYSSTSS